MASLQTIFPRYIHCTTLRGCRDRDPLPASHEPCRSKLTQGSCRTSCYVLSLYLSEQWCDKLEHDQQMYDSEISPCALQPVPEWDRSLKRADNTRGLASPVIITRHIASQDYKTKTDCLRNDCEIFRRSSVLCRDLLVRDRPC